MSNFFNYNTIEPIYMLIFQNRYFTIYFPLAYTYSQNLLHKIYPKEDL